MSGGEFRMKETLSSIFKRRRFCVYCRAAEEFCNCDNEIKFAVWEHAIKEDIKEFIKKLKEADIEKDHKFLVIAWEDFLDLAGEELTK